MSTYRKRTRDEAIADDANSDGAIDKELMCRAHGCPLRWSVLCTDRGINKLCSHHAWKDPERWPRITQRLLDAEADFLRYGSAPKAQASNPKGGKEAAQRWLRERIAQVRPSAPRPSEEEELPW